MPSSSGDACGVTFVMGAQWGDEGKGKVVDWLASRESFRFVCRCQGGNNAGHTVVANGVDYDFHLLPSGIVSPEVVGVIGHGVVVHVGDLFAEIDAAVAKGLADIESRLRVSDRAHLVFDFHQTVDGLKDTAKGARLGTTRKGIGPTYSSKMHRNGLRVCDLLGPWEAFAKKYEALLAYMQDRYGDRLMNGKSDVCELERLGRLRERLRPMVLDTALLLNEAAGCGDSRVLVEGAQSCMLDIDVGTYPYVTSSNCTVGGLCTGLGVPPSMVTRVLGVAKAYTTRVGAGTLPTELTDSTGDRLRQFGSEFGVTTGRPRRCGWLDAQQIRYAHAVNGFSGLALTKLDVLDAFDEVKVGVAYRLDGQRIKGVPAMAEELDRVEVEYLTMPGWLCSIGHCRSFDQLPAAAKNFVEEVERQCAVPIVWIGVGASRDCVLLKQSSLWQ